jgi:hypothetical protein
MATRRTIDEYIAQYPDWRGDAARTAHDTILAAAPGAGASIKWGQPVFESNGPFAYIKVFPKQVNIGFWRGAEFREPDGPLTGDGSMMRHVKVTPQAPMEPDRLADWVRQAVSLNATAGDPTKRR